MKSGQLPSDLKLDAETGANGVKEKDENMVSNSQNEDDGGPEDVEEQKDSEPTAMEQVWLCLVAFGVCVCIIPL